MTIDIAFMVAVSCGFGFVFAYVLWMEDRLKALIRARREPHWPSLQKIDERFDRRIRGIEDQLSKLWVYQRGVSFYSSSASESMAPTEYTSTHAYAMMSGQRTSERL